MLRFIKLTAITKSRRAASKVAATHRASNRLMDFGCPFNSVAV